MTAQFGAANTTPMAAAPVTAPIYRGESLKLADGATIAYYVRPGRGPALVLIPGSWNDFRVFDRLVPVLSKNLEIVIIELRGHGRSHPPAVNGSIEMFADDVLQVVKRLKLPRFYVGGHSIGGMVAIEIAGRKPDGLSGAVSMEGWTQAAVQKAAFGKSAPATSTHEQQREADAAKARVQGKLTKEQIESFAAIWKRWDGTHILETTSLPVLELWGDRGLPRPSRQQLRIPDRSGIKLVWIANASHNMLFERPGEVALAINEFIRQTSRMNR